MELGHITIKIREGEELKLSLDEAKNLQKVLNDIFPQESPTFIYHYYPAPWIPTTPWWETTYTGDLVIEYKTSGTT